MVCGYDQTYGNVITETQFTDYGVMTQSLVSHSVVWVHEPSLAQTTRTTYDEDGLRPVEVRNPLNMSVTMTYDENLPWLVEGVTDPNGATTSYRYDDFGRLSEVFRPGDNLNEPPSRMILYDDQWSPLMITVLDKTDPEVPNLWGDGVMWQRSFYDGLGRLIQTQWPAEDWADSPTPAGHDILQSYAYDGRGLQIWASVPYTVERYVYDGQNPASPYQEPPVGVVGSQTTYDALGRAIRLTSPDPAIATEHLYGVEDGYTYNAVIDPNGHRVQYWYNGLGQLDRVDEFEGDGETVPWAVYAQTRYDYDVMGNLVAVTDDHENLTKITYDALGRKVEMDDPDMGVWIYEYDAAGNLITQTDALLNEIGFYYDALNRLTAKRHGGETLASYSYDEGDWGIGRRTGMVFEGGWAAWVYDARGRVEEEVRTLHGESLVTAYGYDAAGRVTSITYPGAVEPVVPTYNAAGQPARLQQGSTTYVAGATYNPLGQMGSMSLGNGVGVTYEYYAPETGNSRLQRLRVARGGDTLLDFSYSYDLGGNVLQIDDGLGVGEYELFSYDALDRLTEAARLPPMPGEPIYRLSYQYNSIGNIMARSDYSGGQWHTRVYTYSDAIHAHAVTAVSGAQSAWFSYDMNGNMTARNDSSGSYAQSFDVENRLVEVHDAGTGRVTQFVYDADGALVGKVEPGGQTIYAGDHYEVYLDTAPPVVQALMPLPGAADVPLTTTVWVQLDEVVTQVAPGSPHLTWSPAVAGSEALISGSGGIIGVEFTPAGPLEECHLYQVTVGGFQDLWGQVMVPYTWQFETLAILPEVAATMPVAHAPAAPVDTTVVVTLTVAATCPLESCIEVYLLNDSGPPESVAGTFELTGTVATFEPAMELVGCSSYLIRVHDLVDLDCEKPMAPYEWWIHTADVPPQVQATAPEPNEVEVALGTSVVVIFNEQVTCPGGNCLAVMNERRGAPVYGQMAIQPDGYTAVLTPTAGLEESTTHSATAAGFIGRCGMPSEPTTWTFETVPVRPEVISASPAPWATCVLSNTVAQVRFSELLSPTSPLTMTLALDGQPVAGQAAYIQPPQCLNAPGCDWALGAVFTPTELLTEHVWYHGHIEGPQDYYGNPLLPYDWWFGQADGTPPYVTGTDPADGAEDGYPDEPVTAWFDGPIGLAPGILSEYFTLLGPGGQPVGGEVSLVAPDMLDFGIAVKTGVQFSPYQPLAEQTVYTATVDRVEDGCGNGIVAPHSWVFATACLMEADRPSISMRNCNADGFSLQASSLATADRYEWRVRDEVGEELERGFTTSPLYAVAMPYPGERWRVQVRAEDANGCITRWSAPFSADWETCYAGPPQVVAVTPLSGTVGVTVTAGVVVTFNEVVYVGAPGGIDGLVPPTFSLAAWGSEPVPGVAQVASAYDDHWAWALEFVPLSASDDMDLPWLAELTAYQAEVAGATDSAGQTLEAFGWGFTTGDFTPPAVVATVPAGGAFQRPEDTLIRAHMSEPLTGTAGVTFEVLGPDGPVSGIVRYYDTGIQSPWTPWVLQFEPAGPLETDAIYTATVTGAWDEYGNRMVEAHSWSFGTRTTLRFAPLATSPPPGSVAVPLSATLAITFNKPLLAESEGLVSFALDRIDGSMREMVTGTVALAGSSVHFMPSAPLAPAARYQARVVGVMSGLGDRMRTPFRWTFETYDPNPPAVTGTTPAAEAEGVARETVVQAIFDRALRVGAEGAALTLAGPAGPVVAALRWVAADELPSFAAAHGMNTAGRSQSFVGLEVRPLVPLEANTLYTATVKGVENASGVPMVGAYSWHFTTRGGASVQNAMPVETSYYTFGSQRVALRISGDPDPDRNGLYYIHTDHPSTSLRTSLGSTSALSYGQGHAQEGEEVPGGRGRHLPFGEYRVEPEAGLSDRGFTGHRELGGIGLVHMRARLYSPELGRFVSPDILIPDPADPQSYNRYSYVLNNPHRFTDPTGRCPIGDSDCWALADDLYTQYGWYMVGLASHGVWTLGELQILWDAATAIEGWLAEHGGGDARGRMRAALGGTQFAKAGIIGNLVLPGNHHVRGSKIHLLPGFSTGTVVHEIAHVIDNRLGGFWMTALLGGGIADEMARELGGYPEVCGNRSICPGFDAGYSEQQWKEREYGRRGPSEDFAETLKLSVLDPGQLGPIRATVMAEMGRSLTANLGEFEGSPYSAMQRYGQGYIRPHGFGAGSYPVNSLQLFQ